jgi:hypothetical protein
MISLALGLRFLAFVVSLPGSDSNCSKKLRDCLLRIQRISILYSKTKDLRPKTQGPKRAILWSFPIKPPIKNVDCDFFAAELWRVLI